MAAEIYVKEVEKSPQTEEASEVIEEGTFVTREVGGGLHEVDPSTDAVVDGIVPHRMRGPHIREHMEDYSDVQYESGDPTPFYDLEDGIKLDAPVALDAWSAPNIERNNVVGVVNINGEAKVVEEGYTHDTTTYNRSNGNFFAIGVAAEKVTTTGGKVQLKVLGRLLNSR